MGIRKVPSCEEAKKQISMVEYLSQIGIRHAYISGNNYWYHSPLHDESTPSFKVNMDINCWHDWGTGQKGNFIDFGMLYHRCSVEDFLYRLSTMKFKIVLTQEAVPTPTKAKTEENKKITVGLVTDLYMYPLLNYIQQRKIPEKIARQYCKEVHYSLNDKNYYAIGFLNDAGGYELRNRHIKAASSPKSSTFIDNKSNNLVVFEGFFNFLSYKAMIEGINEPIKNYLILNSTSFFNQQLPKMQEYECCYLYLDRDNTGNLWTQKAQVIDGTRFKDMREIYQGKNDLNDWWKDVGCYLKHTQNIKHSNRPQ